MTEAAAAPTTPRWADVWPDALAFAAGLVMAWKFRWQTTDLVWSLWLASLLVGYAMIVWGIFGKGVFIAVQSWREREMFRNELKGPIMLAAGVALLAGLGLLAFFTVHFGLFHFVHSVFLGLFFPVLPGAPKISPDLALYREVLERYWYFLPVAALAERQAFRFKPEEPAGPPDASVKAVDIAARKARNAAMSGMTGLMTPYKNVVRLHLLIFFFAAAHFAKLEYFWIYAVVYAVYFFPVAAGQAGEGLSFRCKAGQRVGALTLKRPGR